MNTDERIASCLRRMEREQSHANRHLARAKHWSMCAAELQQRKQSMDPRQLQYHDLMYGTGKRQATHTMNDAIRLILEYRKVDVMTLALQVGVSHTTIYNLCKGRCAPSRATLDKLGMEYTGFMDRYKFKKEIA